MKLQLETTDEIAQCVYEGNLPYNTTLVVPLGFCAAVVKGGEITEVLREGEKKINLAGGLKTVFTRCNEIRRIFLVNVTKPFRVLWGTGGIRYKDKNGEECVAGANGWYTFVADNAAALLRKFGFESPLTESMVKAQMKAFVLSAVKTQVLACLGKSAPAGAKTDEVTEAVQKKLETEFDGYGLFLDKFFIEEITDVGRQGEDDEE